MINTIEWKAQIKVRYDLSQQLVDIFIMRIIYNNMIKQNIFSSVFGWELRTLINHELSRN
jgi:hypothetical protein